MNFVADENIDRQIVEALRDAGHNVIYIADTEPSIPDNVVFDRANESSALLITGDKDFGEIVFREKRLLSNGVVLLRLSGLSAQAKIALILAAVEERESELLNSFTVISPGRIRISS